MARGCCPWTPAGAYAPRTLRTWVLKKWPPSQPFFCCICMYSTQSVRKLHWRFNISTINTHFDMFWKIKACMGVIYFLVCVWKHESNLPTNMHTTVGKKTQWYVVNATFCVKPHSCLILWQHGVFFFTKVCIFYQWCLSRLSSQHFVSMIFGKQCW